MSNLLKSKFFLGGLVAIVMLLGANIASAAYMHTGLLKMGQTSSQVMSLQQTLNGGGFLVSTTGAGSPGMESMYFGAKTKAAVMAFQGAKGLGIDGVVGINTGTALAAMTDGSVTYPAGCSSTTGFSTTTGMPCTSTGSYPAGCTSAMGFSPTTGAKCDGSTTGSAGPLMGGAGSVDSYTLVSSLSGEEVGEDEEDVQVAGIEVEADSGSDLELLAVKLVFDEGTAGSDFEDYASDVSIWLGDEEVARVDGDEFNDDNDWTKTVSLDAGAIVEAGETGDLVVAITGSSNLDTNDVGDTWTVDFRQVRFADAQGTVISEDPATAVRTFSFESFATSADVELKIADMTGSSADEVNDAHMINVHATDDTDNVKILAFTLEAEGDSDIEIKDFIADVVVSATHVDDMIVGGTAPAARLIIDGEEYGTAAYYEDGDGVDVGADEEIRWTDVDYVLEAGDTVDAYIEIDLLAVDTDLAEGQTIMAQITETQTDDTGFNAEDETGTDLVDADMTGTSSSEASVVYDVTFVISNVDITKTGQSSGGISGVDDSVTFEYSFDVEAVDGSVYIDDACTEDSDGTPDTTDSGFVYSSTNDADFTFSCIFETDATPGTGNYIVADGTTESFSASITVIASTASDNAQLTWEGLNWSEANEAGDILFTGNLDDYKTTSVFINNVP